MPYVGRTPSAVPVTADDIPANSIDASKIIDGAIAVADVADNAITEAKIADAAVVSLKSGRKNLLINGGFDVWQRGTSGTKAANGWTNGYIAADRWHTYGSNATQAKSTSTVGTSLVNTLKIAGSSTNNLLTQSIENGSMLLSGKDAAVSFYIRATTTPEVISFNVRFGSSMAGDTSDLYLGEVTTTTSWVKHAIPFNITDPSVSTTRHAMLRIANSSTEDFEIAQVQLEVGSVATDFEHRSYGEELALCQRYARVISEAGVGTPIGVAFCGSAIEAIAIVQFNIPMRAAPTLVEFGGTTIYRYNGNVNINNDGSAPALAQVSTIGVAVQVSGFSGLTTGQAGQVRINESNSTGFPILDAEL